MPSGTAAHRLAALAVGRRGGRGQGRGTRWQPHLLSRQGRPRWLARASTRLGSPLQFAAPRSRSGATAATRSSAPMRSSTSTAAADAHGRPAPHPQHDPPPRRTRARGRLVRARRATARPRSAHRRRADGVENGRRRSASGWMPNPPLGRCAVRGRARCWSRLNEGFVVATLDHRDVTNSCRPSNRPEAKERQHVRKPVPR